MRMTGLLAAGLSFFASGCGGAVVLREFAPLASTSAACSLAAGAPGAEDIVPDRAAGLLYVSSDPRRPAGPGPDPSGRLLVLSGSNPDPARPLFTASPPDRAFHPHGAGLWTGPDGRSVLMVVNHRGSPAYGGSSIEIFDIAADGRPVWRSRVEGDWLHRPNDVEPVGPDRFYVTSEGASAPGAFAELAGFLAGTERSGSVLYWDGRSARRVAGGLAFANSLARSNDGARLYATSTVSGRLHVYRRLNDGGLSEERVLSVGAGPDNIDRAPDGDLFIAAHPRLLTFLLGHTRSAENRSPSRIVRVRGPESADPVVEEVFVSDGRDFSAVSVAVSDGPRLIMGAVYDDGLRICVPAGS